MEPQQRKRVGISSTFFPVDEKLLPQLNITPAQHKELRGYAAQAALDAIRDGPTWGRSNIECAVSSGWKVLSARPTACLMAKKQTKKKERKARKRVAANAQHREGGQQQPEDDKRVVPPTPRVTSLGSFQSTNNIVRNPMPFQSFASVPFEAASGQQFMAHAVLPNSLEDVMNTLYCEQTHEMRAMRRKLYGEATLDCCVLQTLEGATLEDPFWYLGLKWLAVRSPVQAFIASREFVYLEHLGTHVDPETGRRILYRVTQSIQIKGYGGQDSYFGLKRGHVEAAFVYWMDDENEVMNPLLHVCAKGRIHMKGSMPDILMYKYIKAFWSLERSIFSACRLSVSLGITISSDSADRALSRASKKKKKKSRRRKVPSGTPLEMTQDWVADKLRSRCSVCNKKFRLVRRLKHHCRVCGEIMCRECMFHHRVNVRAAQSFRGLRGTIKISADLIANMKATEHEHAPINFEETMTCSFDKQVGDEDSRCSEFNALVNARKSVVADSSAETAVLGGGAVVYVMLAKVCLRCLQSVPLVNRSKSKSTQRRRHSDMKPFIADGNEVLGLNKYSHLRSQTWTPDDMEIKELHGPDDDEARMFVGELDLPMLVVDDTDAESVDGLAEMKRRPGLNAFDTGSRSSVYARHGSYAQEWNGHEDGGLDSHANHERVMILSPHALSTSSSHTSLQMYELVERDDDSNDSSGLLESYSSQHISDIQSSIDSNDNDSIQFYPTQTNRALDVEELKPVLSSFFELKDGEKNELAVSAGIARAAVRATEKVLRRMRDLQDDALYQNRRIPSPSASTTSLCSEDEEDECTGIDKSMRGLRQALAQVESSLADQARIICTIEQERKKEAATSSIFATAAPSKA
ncbi:unnamed protein product [Peronospora destructor]|uniref:FYVE-type domain-containing protein n=1 Tax=Peronospora destructor TaxID=86335 RepID=A0AAV0UH17_9STRA|nr:unnamed protein product [Peronospora destructor]